MPYRPICEDLWRAAAVRNWNRVYQETSDRALVNGVPRQSINSVAAQHADYLVRGSMYAAPAIPYVTVGPNSVR